MNSIKMTFKNADGQIIEKQVEERLVSTYKSMGWELKKENKQYEPKSSFVNSKKNK